MGEGCGEAAWWLPGVRCAMCWPVTAHAGMLCAGRSGVMRLERRRKAEAEAHEKPDCDREKFDSDSLLSRLAN